MDFLKKFNTETQYDADVENLEYATVSYIEDIEEVRYMKKYIPNYSEQYLTFEVLEDGTFTLNIPSDVDSTYMTSVSYSTDNGETWTTTTVDNTEQTITTPTINAGDKVLWKGVGKQMSRSTSNNYFSCFSSTGNFKVSGNIMSLLYGDEFANQVVFPSNSTYNFYSLFTNNNRLISAENLILPATTLASNCYNGMFNGCTSLTTAPVLPATTLASNCYNGMFNGCTSLTTAPSILPATTLATACYYQMFYDCTSLTTAPELPATTLATACYNNMFYGCRLLTTAPYLPATTLADYCYGSMFGGCSSLNYIKAMFTTTPSSTYADSWVAGVAATGTFVKNSAAEWDVTGTYGIPTGWTVQTANA